MVKGAYMITDGGYLPWEATQAADRLITRAGYVEWRKRMESVRKDIECFFGRLKARFRILKTPVSFHRKENIDDMFFTCVGLQNMIHLWNKETSEVTHWEVDTDFEGAGGDFADDTEGDDDARLWCRPRLRRAKGHKAGATYFDAEPTDDFSGFGKASMPCDVQRFLFSEPIGPGEKERHDVKQAKLVEHFKYACAAGVVHWLRS